MADEGFHEIQLNGKQLVFLFMATTIVAVVIFLSGVMVGRGVRSEKAASAATEAGTLVPGPAPVDAPAPATAAATAAAPGTKTPGGAASDELSYYNKLQTEAAPPETLNPPAEEPAAAQPADEAKTGAGKQPGNKKPPAAEPASRKAAPAAATEATEGEPPGPGLALQVAAFKERAEANAVANRLKAKGYPAYVLSPTPTSTVRMFRVRVGKYKTRREAEEAKRRLEKEEQFKPLFR